MGAHNRVRVLSVVSGLVVALGGCAPGSVSDLMTEPATMVAKTTTGVVLDQLPPPRQPLDVAVYAFPDMTGQNKENDSFAEFSHAVTQGGAAILTDVLTKAGDGKWFNVVERTGVQQLVQERTIIQNTRNALYGKSAPLLQPLRFAGVILEGGIIGYDTNETTGGAGAAWLGLGADTQYRRDQVTVALRAVSVQTGRVMASVTTTKEVYSVLVHGSYFYFLAVDKLLQAEAGYTRTSPVTLAVREGVQLAVYSLIFEGVRDGLWQFKDPAAGRAFMKGLDDQERAIAPSDADLASPPPPAPGPAAPATPEPALGSAPEPSPTPTAQPSPVSDNGSTPVLSPTPQGSLVASRGPRRSSPPEATPTPALAAAPAPTPTPTPSPEASSVVSLANAPSVSLANAPSSPPSPDASSGGLSTDAPVY